MNAQKSSSHRALRPITFWLVSILIGIVAGLGAVVFRALIAVFHNVFFLGNLSLTYHANQHTAVSPWGAAIVLVPMIGALGVAFLVNTFAPEAKGHGVPEVMEAVYYRKGFIRPVVAVIKSLASALSIGSGGSVGREGPIVQIGSSFGSTLGQLLRLPSWQCITMVAAGAGGGIAATFNTPIGGILFAVELLLPEISSRTLIPVTLSTATATYIGRLMLGANPSFIISGFETPSFHPVSPWVLLACVGLGILLGIMSTIFIKAIYGFEDFFDNRVPGNYYLRHLLGMLPVGIMIYIMQQYFGHYYIQGVGYAAVQDALSGTLSALPLLLLLFILKLLATSLTLGSGGSGGIFSPSLFLGAMLGCAYGVALKTAFPSLPISPAAFAVVGMAAVVGSVTGAAITAIVMIFEMTLDYSMILPMTLTVVISYGVRTFFLKENIYALKLFRRGQPVPEALQANFFLVRQARDYMNTQTVILPYKASLKQIRQAVSKYKAPHWLLIEDGGTLIGLLRANILIERLESEQNINLENLMRRDFRIVATHTAFFELVTASNAQQSALFVVSNEVDSARIGNIQGVISKAQITQAMSEALISDN